MSTKSPPRSTRAAHRQSGSTKSARTQRTDPREQSSTKPNASAPAKTAQHGERSGVSTGSPQTRKRRGPQALTADQFEYYQSANVKVLTGEDGQLSTSEEERKHLILFGDGTLIVDKTNPSGAIIRNFRGKVSARNIRVHRILLANLSQIQDLYNAHKQKNARRNNDTIAMGSNSADGQDLFLYYVALAFREGASDLHVYVYPDQTDGGVASVWMRVDGVMDKRDELPAPKGDQMCRAAFAAAEGDDTHYLANAIQDKRLNADSDQITLPPRLQSLRLHWNPMPNHGRHMNARLLPYERMTAQTDIDVLGYAERHIEKFRYMRRLKEGMNIISGPTGSGKSTTLQKCLVATMEEKRHQEHLLSVEDPPEYELPGVQLSVGSSEDSAASRQEQFRKTIAAALRSDPDIIMIGEIRDKPSTGMAFEAAMTGHQVWTSVHSNDALTILSRLYDQAGHQELYKITDASLITGLIAQRLMRVLCSNCKVPYRDAYLKGLVDEDFNNRFVRLTHERTDGVYVANPEGCEKCGHRGYAGRTVAAEVIVPDNELMRIFREQDKEAARQYWLESGGTTMFEHALEKLDQGLVDPRDVESRVGTFETADPERCARFMPTVCNATQKSVTTGLEDRTTKKRTGDVAVQQA